MGEIYCTYAGSNIITTAPSFISALNIPYETFFSAHLNRCFDTCVAFLRRIFCFFDLLRTFASSVFPSDSQGKFWFKK